MKQEVTRMHKPKPGEKEKDSWSLDDMIYHTTVTRETGEIKEANPEGGVYIRGLILHGARWNKTSLDEPIGTEMFFDLPILFCTAISKKKGLDQEKMTQNYYCPVYKYPKRTDRYLIFRVYLGCDLLGGHHKAKLRGIALLCSKE